MIHVDHPTVRDFHKLYYEAADQTWYDTSWFGAYVQKCPLDLWIYQGIICETLPDLIIETGTMHGGSARFMASILDLLGNGEIVTIDIEHRPGRPIHPRITYLTGSSTDPRIVADVGDRARDKASVMVILDSDHRQHHVLDELRLLSPLVTPGNYLIVEDSNVNGNPVLPDFGPGPHEALGVFLAETAEFDVDHRREKLLLTFNPGGFLRKRGKRARGQAGERHGAEAKPPSATSQPAPNEVSPGARPASSSRDTAAATVVWRAADGVGGSISIGGDGHPRVEFAPAGAVSNAPWVGDAPSGEFRLAVAVATDASGPAPEAATLYLDLMKKCLTRHVFQESGPPIHPGFATFDPAVREQGRDWPADAETMVGLLRLENIQTCVVDVLRRGVPGDLIETGVWRGGATIFMRAILKAYGERERRVWVADSFAGLPQPNVEAFPQDRGLDLWQFSQLAVSLEQVKANFERYGLLDDQVRFLKGWFSDTLPTAPIDRLAVLRLDGDLYESTMDALQALYPKVSVGGYVIVDDYSDIPACRAAVEDYRAAHGITDPILPIDWTGVYWRRTH